MEQVDAIVIGAGVIGLAIARRLSQLGREVLILEQAGAIGTETSARNSEVIHAGLYYPPGSLKATGCVAGKHRLYRYAEARGVPCRRVGKIIVATAGSQREQLESIFERAHRNGVDDLEWLDKEQIEEKEPAVRAELGLWSPSTGIIDSHALMLALLGDAEAGEAVLVLHSPVQEIVAGDGGLVVATGGEEPMELRARSVVNAAGLHAHLLAGRTRGLDAGHVPRVRYLKGYYFVLSDTANPFRHLVYPVPDKQGLGIHVTLDMGGQCRFGPDASDWLPEVDYGFDESRAEGFYAAIRRYWPALPDGALAPGYTGIRPKLSGPGEAPADFLIQGPAGHGIPGLVNLFGIESPGLTACLSIAEEVAVALEGTTR